MMYNEFLAGTGAPENKETYEQFQVIEKIYMDCEHMSKSDAYAIWKKTYGKEIKARKKRMHDRAAMLLASDDEYYAMTIDEQMKVSRELNKMAKNAWYRGDGKSYSFCMSGRCFTDSFGIVWFIRGIGYAPNGSSKYGLFAYVDGAIMDAHFTM